MAKIIYGVMGDAGGHINRSLAVASELPEHEFLFVGGGRTAEARDHGHAHASLPMIATVLKESRVDLARTGVHFLKTLLGYGRIVDRLCGLIDDFSPDLAVTDYEFFLPRAARKRGVPCVSLDHQHVLTHCRYPTPPGESVSRFLTTASIRSLFSAADKYIISSFYGLEPWGNDVEVVPPVLHRDILEATPVREGHVTVYMRSGMSEPLFNALVSLGRECRIYGMDGQADRGNLRFFPASREGFLRDVASSEYVVCNGGHTLVSEAFHLSKPVLAFPAANFYEQYFNGWHLRKLGYGDYVLDTAQAFPALARFEENLEAYRNRVQGADMFGNREAARALNAMVGG